MFCDLKNVPKHVFLQREWTYQVWLQCKHKLSKIVFICQYITGIVSWYWHIFYMYESSNPPWYWYWYPILVSGLGGIIFLLLTLVIYYQINNINSTSIVTNTAVHCCCMHTLGLSGFSPSTVELCCHWILPVRPHPGSAEGAWAGRAGQHQVPGPWTVTCSSNNMQMVVTKVGNRVSLEAADKFQRQCALRI